MNARLTVSTNDLEVNKPQGGGKGEEVLYVVDVMLDGKPAFSLRRHNFRDPGQMQQFVNAVNDLKK